MSVQDIESLREDIAQMPSKARARVGTVAEVIRNLRRGDSDQAETTVALLLVMEEINLEETFGALTIGATRQ
jgi:hypothetical protein